MDQFRHVYADTKTVTVRAAAPEDIVGIYRTLMLAFREMAHDMPIPEPDQPYCMQAMLDLIAQGLVHVAVTSSNEVVGVLVLAVSRWPWTAPQNKNGHYLSNEHFWVEWPYRRNGTAKRLIKAGIETSNAMGLPLMIELASGSVEAPMKDRFVKQCGFMYAGGKMFRAPKR